MAKSERKVKVPMADGTVKDAVEVPVAEVSEPWSEIHLQDGSIIRMKTIVVSVSRMEGQYDQEGNPVYFIKTAQALSVVEVPDHLKRSKE